MLIVLDLWTTKNPLKFDEVNNISFGHKSGLVDSWSGARFPIERLWVRILSHPTLDGNGVKAMPGRLKHPILVHSIQYLKRKKIQAAKWGTPKIFLKKDKKKVEKKS